MAAPWEEKSAEAAKLTTDIDAVARAMCVEFGKDPDELVMCDVHDTMAPHEVFTFYRQVHTPPIVGSPPYEDMSGRMVSAQRWRSFRRDAARALVGWRAVHRYVMTEM